MANGVSGDIKLGVGLETKSAAQSLQSLRKKVYQFLGGVDVDGIKKQIRDTNKEINQQEKSIERVKKKLEELNSSSESPKSVIAMEKELQKLQKDLKDADTQFEKLSVEQSDLASRKVDGLTMEQSLGPEQYSRFQELDNLIIQNGEHTAQLQKEILKLQKKISNLKANPNLTEEGRKYNAELKKSAEKLEEAKAKLAELEKQQNSTTKASTRLENSVNDFGKRIRSLVKSALIFSVITKALTVLRQAFGKALMSNKQFANSVAQIKGNLLTAFMPIYQIALPALQALMNILAKVTAYIAAFVSLLTGKSVDASKKAAQALYNQASAADKAGGANKKAADATEKSTLAFDELNTISSGADTETTSGGGGGSSASVQPFATTDVTFTSEIEEKLKSILFLVGSIGGALALWKLTGFISSLFTINKETGKLADSAITNRGLLKKMGGTAMIVAGGILLIKNYSDAWVNGIDWKNFAGLIGGLALTIGGIALAISPAAAAFAAIGAGVALVVLGIKDLTKNGPNLQNILTIISGVAVGVAGLLLSIKSVGKLGPSFSKLIGPITLVAAGIAALVLGVIDFINNGPTLQNTILIIGGAIAVAVGLASAGLSVLVSIIIAAVVAVGAFVAAILLEKPAIMSVEEAQENLTAAKERAKNAENEYINAIDNAEQAERRLAEAEKAAGITGQELFEQVQAGTLDYKNMNDAQKELYKAYLDNEQKQKDLKTVTEELTDAKKDETIASLENELALAKESGSYDEYKTSVVEAFKKGRISAAEARDLIGKSMSEMSNDAQKTFMEDLPESIKDGLDPHQYESTKTKISKWFSGIWDGVVSAFKSAWDGALNWWRNLFGNESESGGADKTSAKSTRTIETRSLENVSVSVPALARGTVLPPNQPFLAMVGDQKHGTNIEAPLSTIEEAVENVLNKRGYTDSQNINITFTGNLAQLARVLKPQLDIEATRKGVKLVKGGAY